MVLQEGPGEFAVNDDSRWYVYMVKCSDGSLYTGVTSDVARRLTEHVRRGARSARYTRSHPVVGLAMLWRAKSRGEALSLEWHIHHSSRTTKEELVKTPALANRLVQTAGEGRRFTTVPANWRNVYWLRATNAAMRDNGTPR